MHLSNMGLDRPLIAERIAAGLVAERRMGGLSILNYTPRAQYSGAWDHVTRQCRGLILDGDRVVARSLPKFFNYGQPGADAIDLDEQVVVMDKVDGSLGVIYPWGGGHHVATRGSFESPQAAEACAMFDALGYAPPAGLTVLVEIVYPGNRIVLDYGERRSLVLLGATEIATGATVFPADPRLADWPGERVEVLPCRTLREALAVPPRPNAEGHVVVSADGMRRVKIKQEDYVRLHKVLCGLSNTAIWEALRTGNMATLFDLAPDELHPWMEGVRADMEDAFAEITNRWSANYMEIVGQMPAGATRKDFAALATKHECPSAMFAHADGRYSAVADAAWKLLKPFDRLTPTHAAEDT